VWLNGTLFADADAHISPYDRGLTLGDGVFETVRAHGERPLWFADHLRRMRSGAQDLGIEVSFGEGAIEAGVRALLARAGHPRSVVRLTLTRGPAGERGLWPPGTAGPTLLATVAPYRERAPVRAVVARVTRRNEHSPLARMKSLNYGDSILARREAAVRGADEALLLNGQGRIACASAANLLVRIGTRWITPPPAEGAVPGLARARLLERGSVTESPVDVEMLAAASAAVVTTSLGCTDVVELDGRPLVHRSDELRFADLYV
jgi:branched-chain amino acid aminotransferase